MKSTNMKKNILALSIASLSFFSINALADADIAIQPAGTATQATTNVDICVIVPEILIFGVGPQGDVVTKIAWTFGSADGTAALGNNQTYNGAAGAFTAPAPLAAAPTTTITNGGGGNFVAGTAATIPVFLFSNNGSDVTIASVVAGVDGTADALDHTTLTNTIPISEFTFTQAGSIVHPQPGATADTPDDDNGIVNVAGNWTYTYTPATIPAAGTYEARITYTASQP